MKSLAKLAALGLVLAAGSGASGCASGGSSGVDDSKAPTTGPGIELEVTNNQRTEAEIWVFLDGSRQRVGRVISNSRETFMIPMDRMRTVRMEFRLYGGPTCVTRDVAMQPGEAVSYTIPVDINLFDAVCRRGP